MKRDFRRYNSITGLDRLMTDRDGMTNRYAQNAKGPTGSRVPMGRLGVSGRDGKWFGRVRCGPAREAMRTAGVSLFLLAAACSPTALHRVQLDTILAIQRDIRVVDAPAIASHFHELADEAFAGSIPHAPKHYVSLLDIGEDALIARVHLIRAARESIDLQVFIWVDDAVGHLMFDELLRAARRGVRVRLLVDHFCQISDPEIMARIATAHANLDMKVYNPVFDRHTNRPIAYVGAAVFRFQNLNQRMHNKVLIIDRRIGIVGGRNIQNLYYDWDPKFNFRDRDIIVAGPVAEAMRTSFDLYWNHELTRNAAHLVDVSKIVLGTVGSNDPLEPPPPDSTPFAEISRLADEYSICANRPTMRIYPVERLEFVADTPEKTSKGERRAGVVTDRLVEVLSDAEQSIVMQTPYLVMSNGMIRGFKKLRRRHPEMRILFSTNSLAATDAFYVYAISFKQRRLFVKRLKLEIHEFRPIPGDVRRLIPRYDQLVEQNRSGVFDDVGLYKSLVPIASDAPRACIHAKSFVVDHNIAFIGSHNFDPRSNRMNTESGLLIWDKQVAEELERAILLDTAPQNSWVLAKRRSVPGISHFSDFLASISRMLPVFDVWPFRYSTCYALKPGMQPVSPRDPDFMNRYNDVGQFPEAKMSQEKLLTRLFAAFAGWSKFLM